MLNIRKSLDRGHAQRGWLESYHTFSFADYDDPNYLGFRDLRVINEDRVQPGKGFGAHSHRDMEIVSYVLAGALDHKDSLGNGSTIRPGDVQRMSAGTGVTHSEFNSSATEPVHLLQIWILPEREDLEPEYVQKHFDVASRSGNLRLLVSRNGRAGSVPIHQDVDLYAALLECGQSVRLDLRRGRHAWVQVARGMIRVGGISLEAGDGVAVSGEDSVALSAAGLSEVLVFDLK